MSRTPHSPLTTHHSPRLLQLPTRTTSHEPHAPLTPHDSRFTFSLAPEPLQKPHQIRHILHRHLLFQTPRHRRNIHRLEAVDVAPWYDFFLTSRVTQRDGRCCLRRNDSLF